MFSSCRTSYNFHLHSQNLYLSARNNFVLLLPPRVRINERVVERERQQFESINGNTGKGEKTQNWLTRLNFECPYLPPSTLPHLPSSHLLFGGHRCMTPCCGWSMVTGKSYDNHLFLVPTASQVWFTTIIYIWLVQPGWWSSRLCRLSLYFSFRLMCAVRSRKWPPDVTWPFVSASLVAPAACWWSHLTRVNFLARTWRANCGLYKWGSGVMLPLSVQLSMAGLDSVWSPRSACQRLTVLRLSSDSKVLGTGSFFKLIATCIAH